MGTEVKDRKTLKEAAERARAELAGKRRQLAKAEETRMFTAADAAKGTWKEKAALTRAEDVVARLREEVALAERDARQAQTELDRDLAHGEELDAAAHSRRLKEDKIKVTELGALLRQSQERGIAIAKQMAGIVLEAQRRVPKKLVARRCQRVVEVEVLDEHMLTRYGARTRMPFFNARAEAEKGTVRIIPDEKLTLSPEDFEYEEKTPRLPDELEVVKGIRLGLLYPGSDMREEITFNRIVAMLEEGEPTAAKAAGRK